MKHTSTPRSRHLAAAVILSFSATLAAQQQLALPDNMNLGAVQSLTSIWRTTAGRFQAAYDTTHFTNAGATGPVLITRLKFRAEDGQPDLGGHVYTGVSVEVGTCAVDHAALSTTFASNRGTMGTAGIANVTLAPAPGTVPNGYVVDIDLTAIGATFLYDPTLGQDLLIDISYTAPAPNTNVVPFSTGSSTVATARGRMITTGTVGATTGTSSAPPTMLIEFAGSGGYAAHNPARSERFGTTCSAGGLASFYQDWQITETFDLANTGLMLVPNNIAAPTGYLVLPNGTPPDLTKVNATPNSVADDAVVTHTLGFTFAYPGGSTGTIKPCTNGFIWLDAAMTSNDLSPTVAELLGISSALTARLAPFWYDLHAGRNTALNANAGLHVLTDTSGGPGNAVCYVTWHDTGIFNQTAVAGTSVSNMQVVIHEATGVVEYRYGAMQVTPASLGVTGWSPGRVGATPSMHPGPRDLSHELPFTTQTDGAFHGLSHNVTARPIMGTSVQLQSFNQPAGATMGAFVFSFAPQMPAISIPPFATGCGASVPLGNFTILEIIAAPTGTVTGTAIPVPTGVMGAVVYTQYAALDGTGALYTSNGLKLTVGLN